MKEFIDIVLPTVSVDLEGFSFEEYKVLASIRAYKEERHGSVHWANMASFSEATTLFRFRKIPGLEVTTNMLIICEKEKYKITSVENVNGRNMYVEVHGKEIKPNGSSDDKNA